MKVRFKEIALRWQWDHVKATLATVRLAIRRTGNSYGITLHGKPYITPKVGMRVLTSCGEIGFIDEVRQPMRRGGDPEVRIGKSYLFQTAMRGYVILNKPSNRHK